MTRIQPAVEGNPETHGAFSTAGTILAHLPGLSEALDSVKTVLRREGSLSPKLVELIRLRLAFHNQCRTCMAVRYLPDEVDEGAVCSLERPADSPNLTDAERAALHFADLFATNHLAIDAVVYDGLRSYYSEAELVELGLWCSQFVGFGRLAATWNIVEDLPESFRAETGSVVTPWGHAEVVRAGDRARR